MQTSIAFSVIASAATATTGYVIESGKIFRGQHDNYIVPVTQKWWANGGKEQTKAAVNFLLQVAIVMALIVAAGLASMVYLAAKAVYLAWANREEIVQTEIARWANVRQALAHYTKPLKAWAAVSSTEGFHALFVWRFHSLGTNG